MFAISVNHKNVKTEIREKFAFDEDKAAAFLCAMKEAGIEEAVYLSTCNRVEVYGEGNLDDAVRILSEYSGTGKSQLKEYAFFFDGYKAMKYLFRVTAGLESMVIGEDEILGQMKTAYMSAKENGYTGYKLNAIFQAAFTAARKIKTETLLSKSSVSVATIAAAKCHYFKDGFKKILVFGGSGDTGQKVIKNLLSYEDCEIKATVRTRHVLAKNVEQVSFEDRYKYINEADIIVSSTKSPHYVLTHSRALEQELEEKPRLFVDLAVPRDIDEEITAIPGAQLLTINEIEALARENNEIKKAEVEVACEIIEETIDELLKTMEFHEFMPVFNRIAEKESFNFRKFVFEYRDMATAREFSSFLKVLRNMEAEIE